MREVIARAKAAQDGHDWAFQQEKRAWAEGNFNWLSELAGIKAACLEELAECMWALREMRHA